MTYVYVNRALKGFILSRVSLCSFFILAAKPGSCMCIVACQKAGVSSNSTLDTCLEIGIDYSGLRNVFGIFY